MNKEYQRPISDYTGDNKIIRTKEEAIEYWKPVVDFSSQHIEETPEDKKEYVSLKLEEYETLLFEWLKAGIIDNGFFKFFIPQVRYKLGDIEMVPNVLFPNPFGAVEGVVIKDGKMYQKTGDIGIPYKTLNISHAEGYYMKNESGVWEMN